MSNLIDIDMLKSNFISEVNIYNCKKDNSSNDNEYSSRKTNDIQCISQNN